MFNVDIVSECMFGGSVYLEKIGDNMFKGEFIVW